MSTAATKKPAERLQDGITVATPVDTAKEECIRVKVLLPLAPEAEAGMKTDPYEHVTITNRDGAENRYYVKRGEWVDVPVPVFEQLRQRYPLI